MSASRCSDCQKLKHAIKGGWPTCSKMRLCREVDPALVLRYPGEALGQYRSRARSIEIDYAMTLRYFQQNDPFPVTGPDLLAVAVEAHERVFQQGDPQIAGQIRAHECTFGRHGHERRGSEPHRIRGELSALQVGYPPKDVAHASWWGARFLQQFFAIHPFTDGNGRVARLLLTWGVEESGDIHLREDWFARGAEKEYESALEFAHANAPGMDRAINPYVNHLSRLAAWLRKRIATIEVDDDSAELAEPDP